jgi:hypothetical protein
MPKIYPLIQQQKRQISDLCIAHRVRRLALFGSAAGESFDLAQSDLDFLVEFQDLGPGEYADAYFGLLEGLQSLFNRPVDLVMASAIDNPYLAREIRQSEVELYAT